MEISDKQFKLIKEFTIVKMGNVAINCDDYVGHEEEAIIEKQANELLDYIFEKLGITGPK